MYKVLIVDDEPDIHVLTEAILKRVTYQSQRLDIFSAYTGQEAVEHMQAHPDTALVLMDVVMESNHAGLEAIQTIRNELNNPWVRIIIRTGQPGEAPEKEVIQNYPIDGYISKLIEASQQLFANVLSALKSFEELVGLKESILNALELLKTIPQTERTPAIDSAQERLQKSLPPSF